jgi:nitric oxide reductase NorD protein
LCCPCDRFQIMAYVQTRKNKDNPILLLFPLPFYTSHRIYYEEDLEEVGIHKVLDGLSEEMHHAILDHARTLANVQPELAFHFLLKFPELLQRINVEDLDRWVSVALDIYDSKGLEPARDFVVDLDRHPLFIRHWGKGVSFQDVHAILLNYLRALGREEIAMEAGSRHYTDVTTIYLPERVSLYPDRDPNFLLYKVMVTHKFAQIKLGTFFLRLDEMGELEGLLKKRYGQAVPPNPPSDLSHFIHLFPDGNLATDLFVLADTMRIERWMAENLPGLFRELKKLKKQLALKRRKSRGLAPKTQVVAGLVYWWLTGSSTTSGNPLVNRAVAQIRDLLLPLSQEVKSVEGVAKVAAKAYEILDGLQGIYQAVEKVPYLGDLMPEEAERGRRRKRESTRLKFRHELAKLAQGLPDLQEITVDMPAVEREKIGKKTPQEQQIPHHLLLDGDPAPIPEGMQKIIEEICEDLGCVPNAYLAMSDEMSGHSFRPLCRMPEDEVLPEHAQGTGYVLPEHGDGIYALDEWDYRRQGYRKRWAFLRETSAATGSIQFAEETLERHRGMIRMIKRQFERIRMGQNLLRRQKDGDAVDFDAAVEAFADRKAGLHPSDRVFTKLIRDKRDIATAFLIDLSGSTSGWINDVERAALLIMSEAMQVLDDRFGIYGFSGRTRRRCELFRIKGFDEPYGDKVKRRIANLKALEYTRLGPPIRHLANLLFSIEARTKLLITLSDGKPDDYDGYSGDYGIEDTRQALGEAKRLGIHPFCITIDKAEHSYLSRMYGAVNYVFIDDLSKLPFKIPEIYRKLTT